MEKRNIKILLILASFGVFVFACITSVVTINYYNRTMQCLYNGSIYNEGESFLSIDGCNSCACNDGEVNCTLKACVGDSNSALPTKGLEIYCYTQDESLVYSILPGTNRMKSYEEVTADELLSSPTTYHTNKAKDEAIQILTTEFYYSQTNALKALENCTPAERLQ